ncbi:hypothetical protein GGF31_008429 [Allomyces arbusculus]|nr:hypothetical protein GGF31_008429 [Allomyces arbusculus]
MQAFVHLAAVVNVARRLHTALLDSPAVDEEEDVKDAAAAIIATVVTILRARVAMPKLAARDDKARIVMGRDEGDNVGDRAGQLDGAVDASAYDGAGMLVAEIEAELIKEGAAEILEEGQVENVEDGELEQDREPAPVFEGRYLLTTSGTRTSGTASPEPSPPAASLLPPVPQWRRNPRALSQLAQVRKLLTTQSVMPVAILPDSSAPTPAKCAADADSDQAAEQ